VDDDDADVDADDDEIHKNISATIGQIISILLVLFFPMRT